MTLQNKSCGDVARELVCTQGIEFCVGLILCLVMYVSGGEEEKSMKGAAVHMSDILGGS